MGKFRKRLMTKSTDSGFSGSASGSYSRINESGNGFSLGGRASVGGSLSNMRLMIGPQGSLIVGPSNYSGAILFNPFNKKQTQVRLGYNYQLPNRSGLGIDISGTPIKNGGASITGTYYNKKLDADATVGNYGGQWFGEGSVSYRPSKNFEITGSINSEGFGRSKPNAFGPNKITPGILIGGKYRF